ncbi:flagellar motor switch protein FliM, partial [Vibrio parahaemolyticus V-223/04]
AVNLRQLSVALSSYC